MMILERGSASLKGTLLTVGSAFQVELFKIAARTGSGPFAQGTYTRYSSLGSDQRSVLTTFLLGEGITIITPTCSVDAGSRNILVDFGKVAKGDKGALPSAAGSRRNPAARPRCSGGGGPGLRLAGLADGEARALLDPLIGARLHLSQYRFF